MFLRLKLLLTICEFVLINAFENRLNGKIIGGEITTILENPWQASLQVLGFHNCGASIISEDTLVTAAHCLRGFFRITAFLHTIVVGTSNLSTTDARYAIESVKVHENYSNPNNDIALIKLSKNLVFGESIQPIKLPNSEELADGTPVNVTGWGLKNLKDVSISNELQTVTVQILNREMCRDFYSHQSNMVTEQMICARVPEGGKDACYGDSGGPLSRYGILYGVVSWGIGCGEALHPGVYTNVVEFVEWIKENADL